MLGRVVAVACVAPLFGCVSLPPCEDADGDGYRTCDVAWVDCDDRDPAIHPGALEQAGDGADRDCDGQLTTAPAVTGIGWDPARGEVTTARFVLAVDDQVGLRSMSIAPETAAPWRGTVDNGFFAGVTWWREAFSQQPTPPARLSVRPGAIAWCATYAWDATALAGTSRFVVYPDGRLVRGEAFTVRPHAATTPPGEQFLTAFLAMERPPGSALDWQGHPGPPIADDNLDEYRQLMPPATSLDDDTDWLCAQGGGGGPRLAIAARGDGRWRASTTNRVGPGGARVPAFELAYDLVRLAAVPPGDHQVDLWLAVRGPEPRGPCVDLADEAEQVLRPQPRVGGATYVPELDRHDVVRRGDAVSLSVPAGPPLTLRIGDVDAADGARDPVLALDGRRLVQGTDYLLEWRAAGGTDACAALLDGAGPALWLWLGPRTAAGTLVVTWP